MKTDTLFVWCPYCAYRLSKRVPRGEELRPWEAARWHESMARHVRRKHVGKNARAALRAKGGG